MLLVRAKHRQKAGAPDPTAALLEAPPLSCSVPPPPNPHTDCEGDAAGAAAAEGGGAGAARGHHRAATQDLPICAGPVRRGGVIGVVGVKSYPPKTRDGAAPAGWTTTRRQQQAAAVQCCGLLADEMPAGSKLGSAGHGGNWAGAGQQPPALPSTMRHRLYCCTAVLPTPAPPVSLIRLCRAAPGSVDTALSYCHYTLNDRSLDT